MGAGDRAQGTEFDLGNPRKSWAWVVAVVAHGAVNVLDAAQSVHLETVKTVHFTSRESGLLSGGWE